MKRLIPVFVACLATSAAMSQPMPASEMVYQTSDKLMLSHGQSLSSSPPSSTSSPGSTIYSRNPNLHPIQMKDSPGQTQPGGIFQ
jgi:hypothetical protein